MEYIKKVQAGEILVPKTIQQAIDRHLRDLDRAENDPNFNYYYDIAEANKVIEYLEKLPDPKTMKTFPLAHFQKFIVSMLYGWRKSNGYRKYRKAYISLARKQGKSILGAGLSSYHLFYEREPAGNRQIYVTANSRQQAKLLFDGMVVPQIQSLQKISPAIRKSTKVKQNHISFKNDRAYIKSLASDVSKLDGMDANLAIVDEFAVSRDTKMLDVLESSMGQQLQPLLLIISTASERLDYPMYTEYYPYSKKILDGTAENENYLSLIWEQDSIDELEDPTTWIKSNPLLEIEAIRETLTDNLAGFLKEGVDKGNPSMVYTKNFNMWTQSSIDGFMTVGNWEKVKADKEYDLTGRPIYIGLDLSKTNDLSSISWIVPIEEEKKLYVDSFSFVASVGGIEAKNQRDNIDYTLLEKKGYCSISTATGGYIDYNAIYDKIAEVIAEHDYDLQGIYYDAYSMSALYPRLADTYGESRFIKVIQGFKTLSPAVVQMQRDVSGKRLIHTNNPLLNRAVLSAKTVWQNGALMIEKKQATLKIDPLASLLNAYTEAIFLDFDNEIDDNDYYRNTSLF